MEQGVAPVVDPVCLIGHQQSSTCHRPSSLKVGIHIFSKPLRHVGSLPLEFTCQLGSGERLLRIARQFAAMTGHMCNCHSLTAGSCNGSTRILRRLPRGRMAAECEFSHFPDRQLSICELHCAVECFPRSRIVRASSREHWQQPLGACHRPSDQFLSVTFGQCRVRGIRLHHSIVSTADGGATAQSRHRRSAKARMRA